MNNMRYKFASFFYTFLILLILLYWITLIYANDGYSNLVRYNDLLMMDKIENDWIYEINTDFIQNGFAEYYKTGNRDYIKQKCMAKGYHCGGEIDEYSILDNGKKIHTLARILSFGRHMVGDLWCIYQYEYKNNVYEYWMIKQFANKRRYNYMYCEFFITQAKDKSEKRKIIHKSNIFFQKYKVDDDFSVNFPENELFMIKSHSFDKCPE